MITEQIKSQQIPDNRVIILGAGRNVRGSLPSALVNVGPARRVLDWLLDSFSVLSKAQIDFVAGYMANEIIERYPNISFFFNPQWEETGPVKSLTKVLLSSRVSTFVCYSDAIFPQSAIQQMESLKTDVVVAVDTLWRKRYTSPSRADIDSKEKVLLADDLIIDSGSHLSSLEAAQFTGLLKISGSATSYFQDIIKSKNFSKGAKLSEVIQIFLKREDVSISVVDLQGNWAELDAPQDLARFVLGTKAESLERLKPLVRKGKIGEQVAFTYAQWKEDSQNVIHRIQNLFMESTLIIRSSALREDNWDQSFAGAHKSVLNVPCFDTQAVHASIEEVFSSYHTPLPEDQVLVQEMLKDVTMSGVVMTRTPTLGTPYYVINFDNTTSRTDTVTSGGEKSIRTITLHRDAKLHTSLPNEFLRLIEVIKEVEELVGHDSLDIEFALTQDDSVHVLQVRPIAAAHLMQPVDDMKIMESIQEGIRYFRDLQKQPPFLVGNSTIFSIMTDWNPAEMIGTKPNRLAFSLYRYLITDESWAVQRAEYGYRDVRPTNLIVDFLGHPYVDIRVDFNSFLPALLSDGLAERLVNYYIECLKHSPQLYDKVEFDILHTCITFDFDQKTQKLSKAGFSAKDIKSLRESLVEITHKGIDRCEGDLKGIEKLEKRYKTIMAKKLPPLERAHVLLEDVRRIGVPFFSHLARNAFVAISLLKSLKAIGCITEKQIDDFLASLHTISGVMQKDAQRVMKDEFAWKDFVGKYGHLRPGSYDITSVCYANAPDEFLRPMLKVNSKQEKTKDFKVWDARTCQAISEELAKIGLNISAEAFIQFLRKSIEGRELGKFIFTRNLNAALEAIAEFGAQHEISSEQVAYIGIKELLNLRAARVEDVRQTLLRLSNQGEEAYNITQAVCLPSRIFSETDFVCMEKLMMEPNYVTTKKVRASIVSLAKQVSPKVDLTGKIVVIPNADPGFDWIFARNIMGLVTMYGGANSHMTVRAGEFQLPSAIGVGELLYEKINQAEVIEMDCAGRWIKIVR